MAHKDREGWKISLFLSVKLRIVKSPTFNHHIPMEEFPIIYAFQRPCPHVPYVSGTEQISVLVNANRWPQDEDPADPAIHYRSWPSATCR